MVQDCRVGDCGVEGCKAGVAKVRIAGLILQSLFVPPPYDKDKHSRLYSLIPLKAMPYIDHMIASDTDARICDSTNLLCLFTCCRLPAPLNLSQRF